ncbi:MAG: DUF4386 domain-containing protein, partial [Cytophagales bacterium]|nr:DUF4386 domain-containing protein [Cytophagales bacterium]
METTLEHKQLITTARVTGIWYLILAIAGMIGFLVFHPQIFIANDPQKTLTNIIQQESTARIRLILELVLIVSQALAAIWFYRLFRGIKAWAAWGIGIWGTMNAAAIMISAIAMGAAIDIAGSSAPSFEDKTILIQLLSGIITHAWGVGCLFFGLWLIPMGYAVVDSQ